MTKGYGEFYLDDAMKNLGEGFDYAVNVCHILPDDFMQLFIVSGIADLFEHGNPKYISGKSGTELVLDVLERTGVSGNVLISQVEYDCSPAYWAGWVLAYYQWVTGKSFRDIHSRISMEDVLRMYPTLHEASEDKFVDMLNTLFERQNSPAHLQLQRRRCGYSQRELSERSGVNLRTLQQYELKTKDIGKASIQTVMALANALGCDIETILS